MALQTDGLSAPIYKSSDFKKMANALRVPALAQEVREALGSAALCYIFLAVAEGSGTGRAGRREIYQKVADAARGLDEALQAFQKISTDDVVELPFLTARSLEKLAKAADAAAAEIPKTGSDASQARQVFVHDLGKVYSDVTGRKATRRVNAYTNPEHEYGPFLDFVRAALKPLNPNAIKGVEHDLRKVAK